MDDVAYPLIKEDVMSDNQENRVPENLVNEWLSVEAAALRLGISSRSIARRIQSGQLESRVDANGRRSVLVCLPAPSVSQPVSAAVKEPASAQSQTEQASDEPPVQGISSSQARELAQQALTVVIRSHEETVLASRAEMFAARRSSRRAWAAVAVLLLGASVTVGIVTHNLTAAAALVRQAEQRENQSQSQIISLTTERDQLRDQMEQARVKEAQAQGQLTAITASAKIPATQPSSVAQRFASVLFGE
jgi:hypothetical protein